MADDAKKPRKPRKRMDAGDVDKKSKRRRTIAQPSMLDPWERQQGESDRRYQVFLIYRDQLASGMARRSLDKAARAAGSDPRAVEEWSRLDRWRDRAAAWDRHVQMVEQASMERRLREIGERHAQQLAAAGIAAMQPVQEYLRRVQQAQAEGRNVFAEMDLDTLHVEVARSMRVLPRLVQAERLVHGMSTENVDLHGSVETAEARRQAEQMSRTEQERFLLGEGVVDGMEDDRERFIEGTAQDVG